jgi:putative transposase
VYGATLSRDTISRITDKVVEEMTESRHRPLDRVYPVLFIDAIVVKVRDGQVVNRPVYVVIGVTVHGERDILGWWAGDGSQGAKFWLAVLTEIKNRGVDDGCLVVCDGLKGLPESITTTWSFAPVQTCILHLIRTTVRYAARQHWDELARDLRPVYTAPNAEMAAVRFEELPTRGPPAIRRSSSSGARRGRSSSPSSTTTWRSERSSAPRTPSKASTAAPGEPSEPGATSPPTKPR